jgi:hypothetical protein
MTTPTPFTLLQGADDVACVDGVCAVPTPPDAAKDGAAAPAQD